MSVLPEIEAQQLIVIESRRIQRKSVSELKKSVRNENLVATHNLIKTIKGKVKIMRGDVDRISFSLVRYGFIQAAGIQTPYAIHSGQMMPARRGSNWIAKALDKPTRELADFVANTNADAVVKTIKFNGKEL
jgi:hypothetical protein